MEKETLIKKWLDNDLNPQELEAFKSLDSYESLIKLDSYMKGFKAPEIDTRKTFINVTNDIKKQKTTSIYGWFFKIAAILIICLGIYFALPSAQIIHNTIAGEKSNVTLPDNSIAYLNAGSSLSYNNKNWDQERTIHLDGEAFFDVAKGTKFTVKTEQGSVTVTGTAFNVKQRKKFFEVRCFKGSVKVKTEDGIEMLEAGEVLQLNEGLNFLTKFMLIDKPTWLHKLSSFDSTPLYVVIEELENQYNIPVELKGIDVNQLFTGSFTHENIEVALQSITIPLQLKFKKAKEKVYLTSE